MNHEELRRELHLLHLELPKNALVAWTSGNVSARVGEQMLIKPSGVTFEELTPESMVLTDLNAQVLEQGFSPSSDTAVVPQDSVEYALSSVLGWGHPKPEEFVDGPGVVREACDHPWSAF